MFFTPRLTGTAKVYEGLFGCVGQSLNLELTRRIIELLGEVTAVPDYYSGIQVNGSETMLLMGDINNSELAALKAEEYHKGNSAIEVFSSIIGGHKGFIEGMKTFCSHMNYSTWAAAIALHNTLYLIDFGIGLFVVDMRKTLGQIFFCRSADDWRHAVSQLVSLWGKYFPESQVIIEFPESQIWCMEFEGFEHRPDPNAERLDLWAIRKFKITKTKYYDYSGAANV